MRPERRGGWWGWLAVALWVVALAVICLRSGLSGRSNSVYDIFAGAGRDWRAGRDLYEFHAGERNGPFRYSPLVAAFFAPLSLLPDAVGGVAWRLGCAAVLLGGLAWWAHALLPQTSRAGLFLLVLPLAVGNLNNGQSNSLVLGLILGAAAVLAPRTAMREESRLRTVVFAVALAGAVLLKGYPLAAALLLLVTVPRWQLAAGLGFALILGLLLPLMLQESAYAAEQWLRWGQHLGTSDRTMLPRLVWYRDLRLLLANLGLPLGGRAYLAVQLLAAAMMAGVCHSLRRRGRPLTGRLLLATGLAVCWMTVFGSAAESATYVLLAPSAAAALLEAWQRRRSWPVRGVLLAAYLLLLLAQVVAWFPGAKEWHALGVQPLAGLLLLAGLVAAEADTPPAAEVQSHHQQTVLLS